MSKPVEVVPAMNPPQLAGEEWGTRVSSAGLSLDLDPAIPCDRMRRAVIVQIRDALLAGQRPDGKGPQKALGPRAAALPDRQSPYRGYRSGVLADGIRALKIKVTGNKASSRVVGPPNRNVYLAMEQKRGVNIITGAGAVGEAAKEAALEVLREIVKGKPIKVDGSDKEAGDL